MYVCMLQKPLGMTDKDMTGFRCMSTGTSVVVPFVGDTGLVEWVLFHHLKYVLCLAWGY
jgi:hypothetical protein